MFYELLWRDRENGDPAQGWESEGQIRNLRPEHGRKEDFGLPI
jgi:hypothetical protein